MERAEALVVARRAFLSRSPEATEALAAGLAARLADVLEKQSPGRRRGIAIGLEGDLGAGKTAFVRGAARGLDATDRVHSPSFTLMHTYAARVPIFHFDAWMEGREQAFLDGGGAEWLESGGLALVEWAKRVEPWLPLPRLGVRLWREAGAGPDERRISIEVLVAGRPGARGQPADDSLRAAEPWVGAVRALTLRSLPGAPASAAAGGPVLPQDPAAGGPGDPAGTELPPGDLTEVP